MQQTKWLTIACAILLWSSPALGQKTDVIVLENGDEITGEIKKLELGKLRLSTDAMGTVQIQWDFIAQIITDKTIEVELDTGAKFFGSLRPDPETVNIEVVGATETPTVQRSSIVRLTPVEDTFWGRVDASLDAGFSFTQANRPSTR